MKATLNHLLKLIKKDGHNPVIQYLDKGKGIQISRGYNSSRAARIRLTSKSRFEAALIEHEKTKHYLFNRDDAGELWEIVKNWII